MFCTECGAQQPNDDARFCTSCGAPIPPAGEAAQPALPAQDAAGQPAAPAPEQHAPSPAATAPAVPSAASGQPAKSWYENTYVRIALAIVGVILVVVGISRIVGGLGGGTSGGTGPSGSFQSAPAQTGTASSASADASASTSAAASSTASASSASSASAASASAPSASASSASAASSAASPSASAPQGQASAAMQTIGNAKVGYLQVPASWVDRTSQDIDPRIVDSNDTLYYVDPSTEFTSAALAHYAFAKSVTLSVLPTDLETAARSFISKYTDDTGAYSDVDLDEGTVNGHDAILVTAFVPEDGLQVMTLVLDRDGNGTASVAIEANCGSSEAAATEVLDYIRSWSY